jgi:DNA-directed RNA polymerase specialized sigma24 family protein
VGRGRRGLAGRKRLVLAQDDVTLMADSTSGPELDERLLAEERVQAVRMALSHLPGRWQQLLQLPMADPPVSYAEISDQLGIPIGSIGPTRGRCLDTLRGLLQTS